MNSFVRRITAFALAVFMTGTFVISNVGIVAAQTNERNERNVPGGDSAGHGSGDG